MSRREYLKFKMSPSKVDGVRACRGYDSTPFVETPATISGTKKHYAVETGDLSKLSPDEKKDVQKALKELEPFEANCFDIHRERKISIDIGVCKINGIIDWYGFAKNHETGKLEAHILDYKGGRFFKSAENNGQLEFYSIGISDRYPEVEVFHLYILQPTHDYLGQYTVTRDEIEGLRQSMATLYTEAAVENPPLTAGDHCRLCRYAGECPEVIKGVVTVAENLEGPQLPQNFDPQSLTCEQRERFMDVEPYFQAFFKANKEQCLADAQNGVEFENYYISSRRKPTLIKDPNCIYSALEADQEVDVTYEEFLSTTKVSLKQLEEIVRSKAAKGFGAAKVAALHESLDHCLVSDTGKTEFLAKRRSPKKPTNDGGN